MGIYTNALKTLGSAVKSGVKAVADTLTNSKSTSSTTSTVNKSTGASNTGSTGSTTKSSAGTTYSTKMPDMSRNTALAGKTVYSNGMNVTYDKDGYAVSASNPGHELNAGTDRAIKAPAKEAVLGAADRAQYGGSTYDQQYMTTKELEGAANTRKLAEQGVISWEEANNIVNDIRARYGYNGGSDGSQYNKLETYIFNPSDATTQPLSDTFGKGTGKTTNWTTQQNEWNDDYYAGGGSGVTPGIYSAALQQAQGGSLVGNPQSSSSRSLVGGTQSPGFSQVVGDDYTAQLLALYGEGGAYAQALAAQKAANEAAVQQAVLRLQGQKQDTTDAYNDYYRQAYIDKMNAQKNINQAMAAQGVTGGAAESTLLGLNTAYTDALRQAEQKRIGALSDIDQAISEAQLSGDIKNAEATAQSVRNQTDSYAALLQALQQRYDTLSQQEWNRQYQLSRDAVSDQQYADKLAYQQDQDAYSREAQDTQAAQSWARTLAQNMIAQGNMPDDETLAAAGMTRAQAAGLLPAVQEATYTPTFSQSQVYDAAKRGLLTGNMLRDYNWYVYGDPDYGASSGYSSTGSGYSGGGSSGSSGRSGGSSSGSSGSSAQQTTAASSAGMNDSRYNQEASTIMQYLSQGMTQKAQDRLSLIWDNLSEAQQAQLISVFSNKGYVQ